jgi:hypothetical protein
VNRGDPDCFTTGVELIDAPTMPECTTDADCPDAKLPACDPVNHRCVMCIADGNMTACAPTESCGPDQKCHGCITDGDCPLSGVCELDQSCATASEVRYAIPGGTGDCSRAAPCTFEMAVSGLTMQAHIVKLLASGTTSTFTEPPVSIDEDFPVQIIGKGITFEPDGSGDAITAEGTELAILGLTIRNATQSGVLCESGKLTLSQVTISDVARHCVEATSCDLDIRRSHLVSCGTRALVATGGTHEIRNNFLYNLVSAGVGAIVLTDVAGRFVFNTMANITSPNGASKTAAIGCTQAGQFTIAQNLIARYGSAGTVIDNGCTDRENYWTQSLGMFVGANDFHLNGAEAANILNVQTTDGIADCKEPGMPMVDIDDIDGITRPFEFFCDRGADEYLP